MKNTSQNTPEFRRGIARTLIVSLLLFSLLLTCVSTSFQLFRDYSEAKQDIERELEEIGTTHLQSIINSMWVTDYELLNIQLEGILNRPDIHYLSVSSNGREIIAAGNRKTEDVISRDYPLVYSFRGEDINLGMLHAAAGLDGVRSRLIEKGAFILINKLIEILMVSMFLFVLFYFLVARHLKAMAFYTGQLSFDSLEKPLTLKRSVKNDELDQLALSVNTMRERLSKEAVERRLAEESLRISEEKYSTAFRSSPTFITITTLDEGRYIEANDAFLHAFGYQREEVVGHTALELNIWADPLSCDFMVTRLRKQNIVRNEEAVLRSSSGQSIPVLYSAELIDIQGESCILAVILDISERKRLEDRLLQAQKMESIGTLAGGIAHDFNNILTAIVGFASIVNNKLSSEDPLRQHMGQILKAAERAAQLTGSLLAFSRRMETSPIPVDLNATIRNLEKFLLMVIGEDIEMKMVLAEDALNVMADMSQMEQVLMNLAANARDAMPRGGTLTISTEAIVIDENFIKQYGFGRPGEFAVISISDTGMGMDSKVRERIFEPFFTTKEVNKGTGLGLSMVYGIINQHNGYIFVRSQPGEGTAFSIYLPQLKNKAGKISGDQAETPRPVGGTETILIAEDDYMVRDLMTSVLTEYGYTVIAAEDGESAVTKFLQNRDCIRFVVLDAIMPKKYGSEVFEEIKKIRPDIRGIFLSGYDRETIDQKSMLREGMKFISKPIKPEDLLKIIREDLDKDKSPD